MKAVREAATRTGWPWEKVHFESFTHEDTAPVAGLEDSEFEVAIRSSGAVLRVPKGQSVLQVLRRHGLKVPSHCEAGSCGTCLTRLCDGVPEHRGSFLGERAQDGQHRMLVCVSRARGQRVVLDL
jgi:vanillate O-demethylase ferredoxin subunit